MQNFFFIARHFLNRDISRLSASLFFAAILAVLAGCGSGSIVEANDTTGETPTDTPGTTVTTTAPTLTLALTNSAGATVSSISSGAPGTLKATLKNAAGAVIPNAVVNFSTDGTLATISPAASALTDASGIATVTLIPPTISAAGATTVEATAQVGTEAVSGSMGFTVGTATVTVSAPVLGVGASPLSAFGTTSIDVTVSVGGVPVTTPQNVTFSSVCANVGKAVLSAGAVTAAGGVARGSYRDNGCAGTDVITATAAGVTSASTNLVVTPPTTGSIEFVSAAPSSMSLKGIGGTEASLVSFRVLDGSGKPLSGKTVTFGLSTTVGGIALTPSVAGVGTATSDADGLVVITVNSGTVSTPVRVTASTTDTSTGTAITLTTQSSGLTISTGIPDQDSFSLSATKLFVEDANLDGNTTVLTVRLADHFNNPVPADTVVNFTTEGGSIVASCSIVIDSDGNSNCSSTLTIQDPRPADGRATVLAYAVGEESFIDLNGNGVADLAPTEITDLAEAFRDDNENLVRDANETFIDFNQNNGYDGPDGQYSGVLCDNVTPPPNGSSDGTCSTNKTIHVRKSVVITFSDSTAVVTKTLPTTPIDIANCGDSMPVTVSVVDKKNGNPMPTGTTISFTGSGGVSVADPSSFTQGNNGATEYKVNINDFRIGCGAANAALNVTVVTPGGVTTSPLPSFPVTLH